MLLSLDERRVRQLDRLAATRARVFGERHPCTLATIARWRAAAGFQLPATATPADYAAWHREAGDRGYGNRTDRRKRLSQYARYNPAFDISIMIAQAARWSAERAAV